MTVLAYALIALSVLHWMTGWFEPLFQWPITLVVILPLGVFVVREWVRMTVELHEASERVDEWPERIERVRQEIAELRKEL